MADVGRNSASQFEYISIKMSMFHGERNHEITKMHFMLQCFVMIVVIIEATCEVKLVFHGTNQNKQSVCQGLFVSSRGFPPEINIGAIVIRGEYIENFN